LKVSEEDASGFYGNDSAEECPGDLEKVAAGEGGGGGIG
jgi:hypothetical protein